MDNRSMFFHYALEFCNGCWFSLLLATAVSVVAMFVSAVTAFIFKSDAMTKLAYQLLITFGILAVTSCTMLGLPYLLAACVAIYLHCCRQDSSSGMKEPEQTDALLPEYRSEQPPSYEDCSSVQSDGIPPPNYSTLTSDDVSCSSHSSYHSAIDTTIDDIPEVHQRPSISYPTAGNATTGWLSPGNATTGFLAPGNVTTDCIATGNEPGGCLVPGNATLGGVATSSATIPPH